MDTTAAPKYGPTPYYGDCEAGSCPATARATCASCGGQHCLSHARHEVHESSAAAGSALSAAPARSLP
ncbi:MAG: hypothetical protein ACJ74U_13950 [Jatrophihabitantaceae bacterium]